MPLSESPPTGVLPFEPPLLSPPDLAEFWRLWREEKFWACHEALETVWRRESGPRKLFLQGLIHCAVAVFQHRNGNATGAARQIMRAAVKLERFRPHFDGVDIGQLLGGVAGEIAQSLLEFADYPEPLLELEIEVRDQIRRTFGE